VLAAQPTHSTTQGETGNAGKRDHAQGRGETEGLGLAINIT
jgi:hypothetical protein